MATTKFPPKLEVAPEVQDAIETHAYSNLTAEVGGMLVGDVHNGITNIIGFVPATTASAEQISLTFTHDVWSEILGVVNKDFPDSRIVGWYHTHPSFGLFLSQYDEFIQHNFFAEPGQVALVIDPIAGELAWFAARGKKIEEFGRTPTRRGAVRRPEVLDRNTDRKGKPLQTALIAAGAALVSGLFVWGVTQIMLPPDTTNALKESNAQKAQLQNDISAQYQNFQTVLQSPVLIYKVSDGETLQSIVMRFYGSDESAKVLEANGFDSADKVVAGTMLLLPYVPGITISDLTSQQVLPSTPTPTPAPSTPGSTPTPSVSATPGNS